MYKYFIGNVKEISRDTIALEIDDIAYEIYVLTSEKFSLNERVKLYIYDIVKDENIFLFGFKKKEEHQIFNKLLLVNGIGVKKAIQILSAVSYDRLIYLIKSKNIDQLKKINGIGNKAEAIIFSLFNKIDNDIDISLYRYQNVYLALSSLGFKEKEINSALTKIEDNLDDENALKMALKELQYASSR